LTGFDGNVVKVGFLHDNGRPGELAYADVWPLAGVGVGFVGARLRILFLEVGLGALCYDAVPPPPPPPSGPENTEEESKE